MKKLSYILGGIVTSLLGFVVFAQTAHAATFTVTSNADDSAVDPSVSCATVLPDCTLRSAIEAANAQVGADTIEFDIAGAGVHTFTPASAYDTITEQVTIDGSTQTGASCGTLVPTNLPATTTPHTLLIEVDGTNGSPAGWGILTIGAGASSSLIRGMVLGNATNFASGIYMTNVTSGTVECNYLGTNAAGSGAAVNAAFGLRINDSSDIVIQNNLISGNTSAGLSTFEVDNLNINHNIVGTNVMGTSTLANNEGLQLVGADGATINQNVVSGNTQHGMGISGGSNNTIVGNYAGLGVTGLPLGNGGDGIRVYGSDETVMGGVTANLRNIASANTGAGFHLYSDCSYGGANVSQVYGNYFGTNTSGSVQSGYGNTGAGVEINEYYGGCVSVYKHQIGGDDDGQPNIIAGNTAQGILIHQSSSEDVFSIAVINNSIYGNGQFGIDLAFDSDNNSGVADVDLGPNPLNALPITYPTVSYANNYLNRPTINSANHTGDQLTVNYSFQAPNIVDNAHLLQAANLVGYRLDFYLNDGTQDGAYEGYSQGKTHIGSFIVDGSESNASHVFTSPVQLSSGQVVTATATILWQHMECPNAQDQQGDGPPYESCTPPPPA